MRITHLRRRVVAGRSRGRRWWRRGIGRSRRTAMVAASFSSPRPFSRLGDTLYRPDSRLQAHAQALTRGSWRLSLSLSFFSLSLYAYLGRGGIHKHTLTHASARIHSSGQLCACYGYSAAVNCGGILALAFLSRRPVVDWTRARANSSLCLRRTAINHTAISCPCRGVRRESSPPLLFPRAHVRVRPRRCPVRPCVPDCEGIGASARAREKESLHCTHTLCTTARAHVAIARGALRVQRAPRTRRNCEARYSRDASGLRALSLSRSTLPRRERRVRARKPPAPPPTPPPHRRYLYSLYRRAPVAPENSKRCARDRGSLYMCVCMCIDRREGGREE